LRFPSGEFIRSSGRTARCQIRFSRYRIRFSTGIIRFQQADGTLPDQIVNGHQPPWMGLVVRRVADDRVLGDAVCRRAASP
jgi:hypothetical protein